MTRIPFSFDPWSDDVDDREASGRRHRANRRGTARPTDAGPPRRRLATEGRSGRTVVEETAPAGADDRRATTYDVATHGPTPAPDWLVTRLDAVDIPLGVLKTGKEADVSLLERTSGTASCVLAVKTYRTAEHRLFHRDAGYLEGRRIRRSRETRAMEHRTAFGRELLAGQWAAAEFTALGRLWAAGAAVPYPVQLLGSEVMMEFVGTADGAGCPRLASVDGGPSFFSALWFDLLDTLDLLADLGLCHGDLSPYNVLVRDGRCVLIDLPQVVDVIANPRGPAFLQRDVETVCRFFRRRGVPDADPDVVTLRLASRAGL